MRWSKDVCCAVKQQFAAAVTQRLPCGQTTVCRSDKQRSPCGQLTVRRSGHTTTFAVRSNNNLPQRPANVCQRSNNVYRAVKQELPQRSNKRMPCGQPKVCRRGHTAFAVRSNNSLPQRSNNVCRAVKQLCRSGQTHSLARPPTLHLGLRSQTPAIASIPPHISEDSHTEKTINTEPHR